MSDLAITVPVLFGLAFDVEKDDSRTSGFRPADVDLGAGKHLFGDLRLRGFAAALSTGFAERLVLAGGDEGRYKGEEPPVNRAESIRTMLIDDFGIDGDRIGARASRSNTGGNIAIFREMITESGYVGMECGLMTNLYHLARASMDLVTNGLSVPLFAAEALWLVEGGKHQPEGWMRKNDLFRLLGEDDHTERCLVEICGIADKIRGTYQPRTDTPVTTFDSVKEPNGA